MKQLGALALFICAALCFALPVSAAVGDADDDGKITAADARYVLRTAVDLEHPDEITACRCDADHDRRVTASDARYVLRVAVELDRFTHPAPTGDEPVVDRVPPTCTVPGLLTYRCACGESFQIELPASGHVPGEAVTENMQNASCLTEGGFDTVIYCTACGTELSRDHTVLPAAAHVPGEAVTENAVEPTCLAEGGYDTVVYCTACGTELSRGHTAEEKRGHTLSPAAVIAYIGERPEKTDAYVCETCGLCFADDAAQNVRNGCYASLNAAARWAEPGDTVVLTADWTQTEDLTVPAGVTLLLPLSKDYTKVNTADDRLAYANARSVRTVSALTPAGKQVSLSLTLSGCTLTVEEGALLCVGGEYTGRQPIGGGVYGPHAELRVQKDAFLEVGGSVSVYGYITGEGELRLNGGRLYAPMTVTDYHGGTYSSLSYVNEKTAPFNGYAFVNVQCPLRIDARSEVYAYSALYANDAQNVATSPLISRAKGLLRLGENASLTVVYDPGLNVGGYAGIGRTSVTAEGDVRVSELELRAAGIRMETGDIVFPLPCFVSYTQASGTLTVAQAMKLMPGTALTVNEGAALNVEAALYVMDGFAPGRYSAYHYPDAGTLAAAGLSARARLTVNGTMTVRGGAVFAGIAETDGTGRLTAEPDAVLTATLSDGLLLNDSLFGFYTAITTNKTDHPLSARLAAPHGGFIPVEAGRTYAAASSSGGAVLTGFTYVRYSGDIESYTTEEIRVEYPSPEALRGGWTAQEE